MSAAFTAMLPPLYARLGVAAQYVPRGGGAAVDCQVIVDSAGFDALEGLMTHEPSLRAIAADYPDGIARDSMFSVGAEQYIVRSVAPIAPDGAELRVALTRRA